jgi:SAM-dependent methyltransferase
MKAGKIRPQDWTGLGIATGFTGAVWGLATGRRKTAAMFAGGAIVSDLAGRWLSRRSPAPFPARLRFVLVHPSWETRALVRAIDPKPGQRVLEIGPGAGHHAVAVARQLQPAGQLDVLDLQPELLDLVARRARRFGVTNIECTVGDACRSLPYEDDAFDAAYLVSVLGELPEPDSTLRDLRRVMRKGGRLVVSEIFFDPDFVRISTLRDRAEAAGFVFEGEFGPVFAYQARFTAE